MMTRGKQLARALAQKTVFYDAHERRVYARMVEVAGRIIDDPSLIERGRAFPDRFVSADPHQQAAYRVWTNLLRQPAEHFARELLADTDPGATLRDTAPVFVVLPVT